MMATGNGDIFLAKLDATGAGIWNQHFGDSASANINVEQVVTVDSAGNPTLAGGLYGNADFGGGSLVGSEQASPFPYVAGFDAAGTYAWAYVGDGGGAVQGLSHDAANDVVLAGGVSFQAQSVVTFAGGTFDQGGQTDTILAVLAP